MKILLVEDMIQVAGSVAEQLRSRHEHEVTVAHDPLKLAELTEIFDVAVIDLLFEDLSRAFDRRRLARQVSLTRDQLLITGLSAIEYLRLRSPSTKVVLWTSAEANRRLHLLYAYEELDIRTFCSKSSGTGTVDALNSAILAAAAGRPYVDVVISPYLPSTRQPSLMQVLMRDETRRAVWRALALGKHTREEISQVVGLSSRTIGKVISEQLLPDLLMMAPGLRPGKPLNEVVRFASSNWEFFLDEAIKQRPGWG